MNATTLIGSTNSTYENFWKSAGENYLKIQPYIYLTAFPLYIIIVLTILAKRKVLNSSFYCFFVSTALADWILIIRTILFGLAFNVKPGRLWAQLWLTSIVYGSWAQVLGVFLMTVNRFTAIISPWRYKTMWTSKVIISVILLQFSLPISQILPELQNCCHPYYTDDLILHYKNRRVSKIMIYIDFFTISSVALAILCQYIAIVTKLILIKKSKNRIQIWTSNQSIPTDNINNNNNNNIKAAQQLSITRTNRTKWPKNRSKLVLPLLNPSAAEIRLAAMGGILTVSLTLMELYTVSSMISPLNRLIIRYRLFKFIAWDLFTVSNPYLLLITASHFRQIFCQNVRMIVVSFFCLCERKKKYTV